MSTQYDIFLSYARADETMAIALQARLEENGFRCWRDRDNIVPIEYFFSEHLAMGIERSKVAIAILSKDYLASYYCLQEFVNCRVDQLLTHSKIRLFTADAALVGHPLVEASGNAILVPNDLDSGLLQDWVLQSPVRPTTQRDFSELSADLLNSLLHKSSSEECKNYTTSVLAPLIEAELVNRDLAQKKLRGTHERLKSLQERIEGIGGSPDFLHKAVRSRVAYSYYIMGEYEQALSIRLDDYIEGVNIRGVTDFSVMQDVDMLIQCLIRTERFDEAENLALNNLSLAKQHFGPSHEFTIAICSSLAGVYADTGRYQEAMHYAKAAYSAKSESLNSSSDEWRTIVQNYAFLLVRTGNSDEALPLLNRLFSLYKSDHGLDNIDTAQLEIKLAECHLRLENWGLADLHAQSAMRAFAQLDFTHPLRATGAVVAVQCVHANSNLEAHEYIIRTHIEPLISRGGGLATQVSRFMEDNPEYLFPMKIPEAMNSVFSSWESFKEKGFRLVSTEDSSAQSCGVCIHLEASAARCSIHYLDINLESWSCTNFDFTGISRIEGDVPSFIWKSLPPTVDIAFDGALAGDPDCQFIVGAMCAHRALHQLIRDRMARDLAIDPKTGYQVCSTGLNATHWFSLAARSSNPMSVGRKIALRILDQNTPQEDVEKNISTFWEYTVDFLQKSEYYRSL